MRKLSLFVVAMAVLTVTSSADAGVKGNRFNGFVLIDNSNPPIVIGESVDFGSNGTLTVRENQLTSTGTVTFTGTYTETDLIFVSFWSGSVNDGSPDGKGFFEGVSFFGGVYSTIISSNDVGHPNMPIGHGYIFRSGPIPFTAAPQTTPGGVVGAP